MAKKNEIILQVRVDSSQLKDLGLQSKKTSKEVGSVAKNVQESDRRLKSLTNQTSNSTKAFAKQAQTIGGGLVPIYATIAAQVFALSAAFRFLEDAFNVRNMIEGQKQFGAITGTAYQTLTTNIQEAANGMLKFQDAASAAAIGVAAGLSSGQLEDLGRAASNVSLALGRDLADSFNRLVRGVTKAEPELLDELGIVLRLDPALRKYAISIGKTVQQLNQYEKSQAIANEVLDQATRKFGMINQVMNPDNFALQQFSKEMDDLIKTVKVGVANFLLPIIQLLKSNIVTLVGVIGLVAAPIVTQLMPNFGALADRMDDMSKKARGASDVFKNQANSVKLLGDNVADSQKKLRASGQKGISSMLSGFELSADDPKTVKRAFSGKDLSATQIRTLKTMATKRQGIFANMTKTELSIFRGYLNQLSASNKTTMKQMEADLQIMGAKGKMTFESLKATAQGAFATISRGAAMAGRAVSYFFSAFGWISLVATLIGMIYDAGKRFGWWGDQVDFAGERASKSTEKLKTLNEELERMIEVKTSGLIKDLPMLVEQLGNALGSYDIVRQVKEFNRALKEGYLTQELRLQFVQAAENIELLDVRFKGLSDLFAGDKQIEIKETQFKDLSAAIQGAAMALKQMQSEQQAVDQAFKTIIGKAAKGPFDELRTALGAQLDSSLGQAAIDEVQRAYDNMLKTFITLGAQQTNVGTVRGSISTGNLGKTKIDSSSQVPARVQTQDFLKGLTSDANFKSILELSGRSQQDFMALVDKALSGNQGQIVILDDLLSRFEARYNENRDADAAALSGAAKEAQKLNDQRTEGLALLSKLNLLDSDNTKILTDKIKLLENKNKIEEETDFRKKAFLKAETRFLEYNIKLEEAVLAQKIAQARVDEMKKSVTDVEKTSNENALDLAKKKVEQLREELRIKMAIAQITLETAQQENERTRGIIAGGSMFNSFQNELSAFMNSQGVIDNTAAAGTAAYQSTLQGGGTEEAAQAAKTAAMEQYTQATRDAKIAQMDLNLSMQLQTGIADKLTNGLADGVANALVAVAQGTKSAKEAFGQMAVSILADITTMIIRTMILKAIMGSMTGGVGLLARQGGIMTPGGTQGGGYRSYALGGIADGPDSGYTATLHGREAVVPLGNDKSIPVKMLNGGGGNNNVNIEINMDNGSSNMTVDGAKGFAFAIQAAVTDAIVKEQRSGGLLNGGTS